MICKHCNANLPDDTTVCPYCQAQVDAVPEQAAASAEKPAPGENAGGYEQNAGGYEQNAGGYEQNAGGYEQNAGGYEQNAGGYGQNTGGYGQNTGGYGQSTGGYGQNAGGYMPNERPVNQTMYLVLSILMTVCCCLPAGIVGIVYASKISKAQAMGDIRQARQFASTTRIWLIVGLVIGVILNISMFVMLTWIGSAPQYY